MQLDPILYANETDEIFIVDIPLSIARAQLLDSNLEENTPQLVSCSAITKPFSSNEPKSAVTRVKVRNFGHDDDTHANYASLIHQALAVIQKECQSPNYCCGRVVDQNIFHKSRKRKAEHPFESQQAPLNAKDQIEDRELITEQDLDNLLRGDLKLGNLETKLHGTKGDSGTLTESGFFENAHDKPLIMPIKLAESNKLLRFRIPPRSAFLISNCEEGAKFRQAALAYCQPTRGRFDFILLDPPWPNRSARRRGSYSTPDDTRSLRSFLSSMDLDSYIIPNGLIAIWVTNKPAFRELVLKPGGLFESWNVALVEEWIWVKVTASGEPILPLDGIWRKPYEVLLIGQAPSSSLTLAEPETSTKKRIILGVPDLHSRKPCIKQLVDKLFFQDQENYLALEIFSRHLVAGWFSWGDEVLKYNWERYWTQPDESTDSAEQTSVEIIA